MYYNINLVCMCERLCLCVCMSIGHQIITLLMLLTQLHAMIKCIRIKILCMNVLVGNLGLVFHFHPCWLIQELYLRTQKLTRLISHLDMSCYKPKIGQIFRFPSFRVFAFRGWKKGCALLCFDVQLHLVAFYSQKFLKCKNQLRY